MIKRFLGATVRAILVSGMILLPAILLTVSEGMSMSLLALVAVLSAAFTWSEYFGTYPTLINFRDAPPYNRMRYGFVVATVFFTTLLVKHYMAPTDYTKLVSSLGVLSSSVLDFPFSPIAMMGMLLPSGVNEDYRELMVHCTSISFILGVITVIAFAILVQTKRWPQEGKLFNIWVNFPLLDQIAEDELVTQLRRDGTIYYSLGILVPFLMPVVLKLAAPLFNSMVLLQPHTFIWVIAFWAFVPTSCIMRGIAMGRIASMIENASSDVATPQAGVMPAQ